MRYSEVLIKETEQILQESRAVRSRMQTQHRAFDKALFAFNASYYRWCQVASRWYSAHEQQQEPAVPSTEIAVVEIVPMYVVN